MRPLAVVASLAIGLILSGCATEVDSGYPVSSANEFQAKVLAVTEAAADNDPEAAMTRLKELVARVGDALARGEISQARHDSIMAAIALVRSDLGIAIEALAAEPAEPVVVEVNQDDANEADRTSPPRGPGNNNGNKPGRGNND